MEDGVYSPRLYISSLLLVQHPLPDEDGAAEISGAVPYVEYVAARAGYYESSYMALLGHGSVFERHRIYDKAPSRSRCRHVASPRGIGRVSIQWFRPQAASATRTNPRLPRCYPDYVYGGRDCLAAIIRKPRLRSQLLAR